jgi:hypothetical protein
MCEMPPGLFSICSVVTNAAKLRRLVRSFKMKLPGGADAVVDIAKLRDYCLSPVHPRGRHKARVFAAVLGLTQADADFLREELLSAAMAR